MIAILGAGNMGSSLLGGLIANQYSPEDIIITDPDSHKLETLKKKFHVDTSTDNQKAIEKAHVVILAVKPQIMAKVTQEIASSVQHKKPLVISIAAGIREATLQTMLGGHIPIVRCMPNTPALIGCGATALFANGYVTSDQHNLAESILRAVSTIVWLTDEKLLDTVTALSGCGPAYFFLIMEAMQNAAIELGLPDNVARLLTLQTAYGSARMALDSEHSVDELRRHVTSPGGATEKALSVLEKEKIREIFLKAIHAAKTRSEELANS